MTQRYLQPNNNDTQWFLRANTIIGNSNENITIAPDNSNNVGVVIYCSSYLQVPAGVSNDRPSVGEAGMIRYSTNDNLIEYYASDTASWNPVSLPSPTISNYSPVDVKENETNNYSIVGSNFSISGVSVRLIGNNGAGTIIAPTLATVSSTNLINIQFDLSGTQALFDVSNELPFACKVTNNNSGFSSTITNALTIFNTGPFFIEPDSQTVPFQTFAVGDPSASFTVVAEDIDAHYPLSFSITNGTVGGITDVSLVDPSGAIVKVPDGSRTSTVAGSYAFTLQVSDASGVTNSSIFELQLAEPTISNVNPDEAVIGSSTSIVITGTNFVIDTSISFINGSTIDNGSTVFSSSTQLTSTVTFTSSGNYDISVNNGPAFSKLFTNLLFVFNNYDSITMTGNLSNGFNIYYLDSSNNRVGTVGEAGLGGFVVYEWYDTTGAPSPGGTTVGGTGGTTLSGNFTLPFNASNVDFLLIAGGGGGGGTDVDGGGGGAGGYRTSFNSSLVNNAGSAVSGRNSTLRSKIGFNANTSYALTVGKGGISVNYKGSQQSSAVKGVNSSIAHDSGTVTCQGGGHGGYVASVTTGGNGGSGGGGMGNGVSGAGPGSGTTDEGFNGGDGNDDGAGGGGAGGTGETAYAQSGDGKPGRGGSGLTSYISGIQFKQAGGGAGNGEGTPANPSGSLQGVNFGGGTKSGVSGTRAAVGTGAGGGACEQTGTSGAGGSGYCAIRILITG